MSGVDNTATTTTTASRIMSGNNDDDVVIGTNMYATITHGQGLAQEQGLGPEKTARASLNMFSLQHVLSQPLSDVIPPPSSSLSNSSSYGGYQQQGYNRVIQQEEES